MKVYNLRCDSDHSFEGWFGAEAEFQDQVARGLLSCPVCNSSGVVRVPSAPRLNLAAAETPTTVAAPGAGTTTEVAGLWRALRQWVQQTEDVGARFTDEARRMHHGDAPERAIRGRATPQQARELLEEGIGVLPLPEVPGLGETLQ